METQMDKTDRIAWLNILEASIDLSEFISEFLS